MAAINALDNSIIPLMAKQLGIHITMPPAMNVIAVVAFKMILIVFMI